MPCQALPARIWQQWPFLVNLYRTHEGRKLSVDLFRCESVTLKTYWVIVVMDKFTRRLIGFGVNAGDVDGIALYRMFNKAISGMGITTHLSTDHDPLSKYHR